MNRPKSNYDHLLRYIIVGDMGKSYPIHNTFTYLIIILII